MAVLRRTRILSLLTALLLLMTIICSSCNRIGFTFPKYSYINSVVKGFKNSDDKVNLDGELNDEVWSRMRWLEVSMKSDENVKVRMTSYFGSDGLYFAFDVDDTAVYSVRGRGTTNNSGIELYISSLKGSSSIEGYGYEIDLSANGELVVRKYLRGKYRAWPSNIHFAVKTDGELNTPACKGYTIEAYLPYSMFDGNETKAVYAMPAIIRSLSANSDERRQWYCFGMEDRDASWTKASTWWTFNEEGLLAHDVTFDVGEHGKIEGHSNVVDGDDYTFKIIPDSGYYAKSVKVDGKNVEADLLYKSGVAFYRVENVTANLKITAEFSAIPAEEINVNGKITADSKAESGISAYLVYRGYAKKVELKSDGSYSSSAPAVKGLQLYAEASGYITDYKSVPTSGGTVNLNLKKMYLGSNSTVKAMRQYNESQWDLTRLYESRVRSLSMGKFITIMNTEIFSDTVFASANISLPLLKNVDTRAGFIFYTQDGQDAFVALTMNNEKGQDYYSVQVISKNSSNWSWQGIIKDISKDTAIREKANSEDGVNLSVLYNKGKFDIWINGTKIASNVTPVDKDKNLIPSGSKVAVGLQTWNYKAAFDNLILRGSGIQDSDRGLIGGYIMSKEVTGSGKIDGPSLAAAGDLYKFYVVPSKGWYASSVTVNGVEVVDKLLYENEKAYYCIRGVTGDTKIKAVFKNVPAATVKISGTIKENNKAISGVKAWFVKGGYMQSISLSKDGDFSTQVPDINGFIYATANGYVSKYVPVSQAKNGVLNIDMQKNYIGTNSNVNHKTFYADKWDLSRLGQGIVECLSTDKFTTAMNT
ncbi:MAG: hypothetical protein GX957_13375, partial [Clostridiaceae bacterium]|nr:hypothetical protein [Clostridiaceae bacterium]